ncbi:MAG: MGMT family protein [Pirellulales bacterium]|nr:MGMT family protein [Pirellulales bacterium]
MSARDECPLELIAFGSALGWFAVLGAWGAVCRVTFGHADRQAAVATLWRGEPPSVAPPGEALADLAARLAEYAAGQPVDLTDVPVDLAQLGEFHRRVLELCRGIPYGGTVTYGQLADRVGRPGAARAVGGAMAANPCPIVIPCHRVVAASGRLGGFSSPGGTAIKRRLLELERSGAR